MRDLVKGEWWLDRTTLITDHAGRVDVSGFLGEYAVSAGVASATFELRAPGATTLDVVLGDDRG